MKKLMRDDLLNLGRAQGWKLESAAPVNQVLSAMACGQRVAIFQEVGRRDWWLAWGGLPDGCTLVDALPPADTADALILISDRLYPVPPGLGEATLIYRPPSLALGVATCRDVDRDDFSAQVTATLLRHGLSELSLAAVGVAALRRHAAALNDFTDERELPLLPYPADKLALLRGMLPRRPRRLAGTAAAAALLAAGAQHLLAAPTVAGRSVLAIARRTLS
jgi:cobalt-precorrin 5A hydrolase/precorrin-3B C17-methyltransferase